MCFICRRLEDLITAWRDESELQALTDGGGMTRALQECARDLAETMASLQGKGICAKFPQHEGALSDQQRWDMLEDILKPRDEDTGPE